VRAQLRLGQIEIVAHADLVAVPDHRRARQRTEQTVGQFEPAPIAAGGMLATAADHRRNSRRDLVPDRRPFRDNSARRGGSVGNHRGGSQRGQALSSGGRGPGETSNRCRRAVAAPVFESDKRLSATAQSP